MQWWRAFVEWNRYAAEQAWTGEVFRQVWAQGPAHRWFVSIFAATLVVCLVGLAVALGLEA